MRAPQSCLKVLTQQLRMPLINNHSSALKLFQVFARQCQAKVEVLALKLIQLIRNLTSRATFYDLVFRG